MSFTEAISSAFSKYADFSGRARRSEFWFFTLFCFIISVLLTFIGLSWIFAIATIIPSLSITWRRMHDIGKSGAYSLISFIPVVGWILVLIWCCTDSQPGSNMYGPNPKQRFFGGNNPYNPYDPYNDDDNNLW